MKLHDSSNDEDQSEYGVTDIGNLQPLSPTDQDSSGEDDVSKDVFRLTNYLHQLIRPESDEEPDDDAAVYLMHQLARCLDYIGKTSDVLNHALSSQNLEVRLAAANVLAKLKGIDASTFLPVLAQAATSPDVNCRRQVADAIGDVGSEAAPLLSVGAQTIPVIGASNDTS